MPVNPMLQELEGMWNLGMEAFNKDVLGAIGYGPQGDGDDNNGNLYEYWRLVILPAIEDAKKSKKLSLAAGYSYIAALMARSWVTYSSLEDNMRKWNVDLAQSASQLQ